MHGSSAARYAGPWLTSVLGVVLLAALPLVIVTGLLDYVAYGPQFGQSIPGDVGLLHLPAFDWPTRPSWLYRLTQGLHVGLGLVLVPGGAGQAVVGDPAAVRVAAGAARPRTRWSARRC